MNHGEYLKDRKRLAAVERQLKEIDERITGMVPRLWGEIDRIDENVARINKILSFKHTRRNKTRNVQFSNLLNSIDREDAVILKRFRGRVKRAYPNLSNENARKKAYNMLENVQKEWRPDPEALQTAINIASMSLPRRNNTAKNRRPSTNNEEDYIKKSIINGISYWRSNSNYLWKYMNGNSLGPFVGKYNNTTGTINTSVKEPI